MKLKREKEVPSTLAFISNLALTCDGKLPEPVLSKALQFPRIHLPDSIYTESLTSNANILDAILFIYTKHMALHTSRYSKTLSVKFQV